MACCMASVVIAVCEYFYFLPPFFNVKNCVNKLRVMVLFIFRKRYMVPVFERIYIFAPLFLCIGSIKGVS